MIRHRSLLALASLIFASAMAQPAVAEDATSSSPRIVNGLNTTAFPTAGALLDVGDNARTTELKCSVTLIGCRHVLTAASCLCPDATDAASCEAQVQDPSELRAFFQHAGIFNVRTIHINPAYKKDVRADMALLNLSEKVLGIGPSVLNKFRDVENGDPTTIVGFGNTGDDKPDKGKKRFGGAEVADCPATVLEPQNICWEFDRPVGPPGVDSNTCMGDEGGPMFADVGKGLALVGIHSRQTPQCNANSTGIDSSVFKNRDWILDTAGADAEATQCKSLPRVGIDPEVVTQSVDDTLLRSEDEKVYAFDIPTNTELLRVAVNGFNEKDGDFDVFVAIDREPTKKDNDCEMRGKGFFGVCEFANPQGSQVFVLIKHVMRNKGVGKSCFQIVVTAFRSPLDCQVPARPDNLKFTRRSEKLIRLTWRDNSNDEEGFLLQRKVGDQFNPFLDHAIIDANKTKYTDHIHPDAPYTYRLAAFNECGISDFSPICITNEDRPKRPKRLKVVSIENNGHVTLMWKDRSSNESGFTIQRRRVGERRWTTVATAGENEEMAKDGTSARDMLYEYRVRAKGRTNECVANSAWSPRIEVDTTQTFGGNP